MHMSYIDDLFDTLMQLQQNKRLPPLHLWQPERSGEIDIRIDREGRWYHEGTRIERQPLVALFATILRLETNGYYLVTPVEKMKILVEEVPFIAVDLAVRGSGQDKSCCSAPMSETISLPARSTPYTCGENDLSYW